ncbi:MAG: TlpA family protein disulfide reductase [Nitrososphaeraceae archaeon]
MSVQIGKPAPNIHVSKWVQGLQTNIDKNKGKVILVDVFQVNCPGCFMYSLPNAIEIYKNYSRDDVIVLGLATAFEDYDKNTLENLELLLTSGQVIGDTLNAIGQYGQLINGNQLSYKIPFPVGMDVLQKIEPNISDSYILDFIHSNIPDYKNYPESNKKEILGQVKQYLKNKTYSALTFEQYSLRGTPSTILIDREGILRNVSFGANNSLNGMIGALIKDE